MIDAKEKNSDPTKCTRNTLFVMQINMHAFIFLLTLAPNVPQNKQTK